MSVYVCVYVCALSRALVCLCMHFYSCVLHCLLVCFTIFMFVFLEIEIFNQLPTCDNCGGNSPFEQHCVVIHQSVLIMVTISQLKTLVLWFLSWVRLSWEFFDWRASYDGFTVRSDCGKNTLVDILEWWFFKRVRFWWKFFDWRPSCDCSPVLSDFDDNSPVKQFRSDVSSVVCDCGDNSLTEHRGEMVLGRVRFKWIPRLKTFVWLFYSWVLWW